MSERLVLNVEESVSISDELVTGGRGVGMPSGENGVEDEMTSYSVGARLNEVS